MDGRSRAGAVLSWLGELTFLRLIERFRERRRLQREMRSLPVTPIGALAEGARGRIVGRVVALEPLLTAPLTGRRCVYWCVEIDDKHDLYSYVPLASPADAVDFVLAQDLDRAVIDPAHAKIFVDEYMQQKSMAAFDASPAQRALLAQENLIDRDWFLTTSLRYRESVIEVGDTITVVGEGVREADPDAAPTGDYRSGGRTRLRLTGTLKRPLQIRK